MFKFNTKLNHNISNFYASFTFTGDIVAPIFRIVPFQSKPDSSFFYKEFKTLHNVSVSKSIEDQVHITLTSSTRATISHLRVNKYSHFFTIYKYDGHLGHVSGLWLQ